MLVADIPELPKRFRERRILEGREQPIAELRLLGGLVHHFHILKRDIDDPRTYPNPPKVSIGGGVKHFSWAFFHFLHGKRFAFNGGACDA